MHSSSYLAGMFLALVPQLVVYLTGFVLSLAFMRRCTGPAVLGLLGTTTLLGTTIALPAAQNYLVDLRVHNNWTAMQFTQTMQALNVLGGLGRAVGVGMLCAGIFIGRKEESAAQWVPASADPTTPLQR